MALVNNLSPGMRWVLLAALFLGTLAYAAALKRQGKPLDDTGASILDYEFAWTEARARTILTAWTGLEDVARRQIRLDFGFLLVYPLLLSLVCAMLAASPGNSMAPLGVFLAWAVLACAPLDAVENLALLRMLDLGASGAMARLAALCAGLKFTLVYAGMGYGLLQGLAVGVARLKGGAA